MTIGTTPSETNLICHAGDLCGSTAKHSQTQIMGYSTWVSTLFSECSRTGLLLLFGCGLCICALRSGMDNASLKYVEYNICDVQTSSNYITLQVSQKLSDSVVNIGQMAHGLHLPQGAG